MAETGGTIRILDAIPTCCSHVTTEWKEECAVLSFPRFKRAWMCRFLLPKGMSPDIHVSLEEHGTAVWRMIDGQRTVQEIIDALAAYFQDEKEYPSRVVAYIMQLYKDGFIRLRIKE